MLANAFSSKVRSVGLRRIFLKKGKIILADVWFIRCLLAKSTIKSQIIKHSTVRLVCHGLYLISISYL